jgi:hypothetical protein
MSAGLSGKSGTMLRSQDTSGGPEGAGADFSHIFFRGKSLSTENSAEFLGQTIFQNFFRGKFNFFPTFLGENFPPNFPRKKCTKNWPQEMRKV